MLCDECGREMIGWHSSHESQSRCPVCTPERCPLCNEELDFMGDMLEEPYWYCDPCAQPYEVDDLIDHLEVKQRKQNRK